MIKTLYFAVNGDGSDAVFTTLPSRDEHFKVWLGEMVSSFSSVVRQMEAEGFKLPVLKWSDAPVELHLELSAK